MLSKRHNLVKMELLDSRCSVCKTKDWQCSKCQQQDKLKKNQARKEAAAAKLAPRTIPIPSVSDPVPSGESLVHMIPDHIAQLTRPELLRAASGTSAIQPSPNAPRFRCVPAVSLPPSVDHGQSVAGSAEGSPKQSLRAVLKASPHNWTMIKIKRDGHCLFASIALALKNLKRPELPTTVEALREACAKQLLQWKGIIPGLLDPLFHDGITTVQLYRGEKEVTISLADYCELVRTSLYGGFDEIMMIVQMYKLQISIYHNENYRGGGNPEPVEIFRVNPMLPVTHEANAGNSMHIHVVFF